MVVDGARSSSYVLDNTVFQGTVLGPPLWNTFFSDVSGPASSFGCTESRFADDLSCFRRHAATVPNEAILFELRQCQAACHDWGRRNQVSFDSDKEEFAVLHKVANCGPDFRLLGTHVDTRLSMNLNIEKIIAKA